MSDRTNDPADESTENSSDEPESTDSGAVAQLEQKAGAALQEDDVDELKDEAFEPPIELDSPDLKGARFGILGQFWRFRRYYKKQRGLISKGYVQWYLIDDSFPKPKYVKPEHKGAGIREYQHKGERYLFPREAMLPSVQQGMWTVIHRAGEADPINLRDPSALSIPTDVLEEYLNLRVSSSPPSFWDRINISAEDAVKYAIAAVIIIAVLQGALGGFF